MVDIEELKREIVERLKPLDPEKVILFGSYAYGTPHENSDIDLYVVTKDEFIPRSFKEKSEFHLTIARAIRDLMQDIPTDLITHTKAMHTKFLEMDSMFSRKILKDGISLL
ncbi:MAG: nucleotidyltransferase domain-containing protein [Thiovulaceae bacterium]|jgi:predicted nucleotidyltransferase|nr:nucleotidyltransferase domain-containing protein [Sulfurimonadaceae bacterium]MDD3816504.1 nucleotidyltransferase domain-containing protein [Sulfurimonadaceae bacterium]